LTCDDDVRAVVHHMLFHIVSLYHYAVAVSR
jgi:hypothetical protein